METTPKITVVPTTTAPKEDGYNWKMAGAVVGGAAVGIGAFILLDALTPVRVLPTSGKLCYSEAERQLADEVRTLIRTDVSTRKAVKAVSNGRVDIKKAEKFVLKAAAGHNTLVDRGNLRFNALNETQEKVEGMLEAAAKGEAKSISKVESKTAKGSQKTNAA